MATMAGYLPRDPSFPTKAIHASQDPSQWSSKDVTSPITLSTTFKMDVPETDEGAFVYGTYGNPSRNNLESCLAALEGAKYGFCFSSGMAAIVSMVHTLQAGDHIVWMKNVYGRTYATFKNTIVSKGMTSTMIDDPTETSNFEKAIQKNTRLVWIEGLSNPLLRTLDIAKTAELVHSHDNVLLVIDNTFLTPCFQHPLEFGVDAVIHSCTKYINGHSDVIMGVIMTDNDDLANKLTASQRSLGSTPSPFDCYLVSRSLKTLHLRMEAHMKNGLEVARYLETHPCVEKVIHPGLPSHPQYELVKRQCHGYPGMVSFYMKGRQEEVRQFLMSLKVFTLCASLGGTHSIASLPSQLSHHSLSEEEQKLVGITGNLVRLSVGLEAPGDLIKDLDQAFSKASDHNQQRKTSPGNYIKN